MFGSSTVAIAIDVIGVEGSTRSSISNSRSSSSNSNSCSTGGSTSNSSNIEARELNSVGWGGWSTLLYSSNYLLVKTQLKNKTCI